jgi:hypothetical protein
MTASGAADQSHRPAETNSVDSQAAAIDQLPTQHTTAAANAQAAHAMDKQQPEATQAAAAADGCQFFMSGKKRLCNWPCKPGQRYCGNHLFYATGDGEARVPCPANPNQ